MNITVYNGEKDMASSKNWFAEIQIHVSINKQSYLLTCRAISFGVTETETSYEVDIFGIEFVGLSDIISKSDIKKIPFESQNLVKERLSKKICEKLEMVRKMQVSNLANIPPSATYDTNSK